MSIKKSTELEILRKVYSVTEYPEVDLSEQPDFIVHGLDTTFGVEVTEYYQDDSSSRLINITGYAARAIDEGTVHPKDVGIIEIQEPEFEKPDGSYVSYGKAVSKPILPANERMNKVGAIINNKNKLFDSYNKNLDYIDLVIYNNGDLFAGVDGPIIVDSLKSLQLSRPDLYTSFKNIYILSQEKDEPKIIKLWSN